MTQTKHKCKDIITQIIDNTNSCHWDEYKNIIRDAVIQTVGRRDKPERNDWFDHDCRLVTEKKNKIYKKMIQGRFARTAEKEYKETRKEEKNRKKKENIIIII
jgi:hypothetical protein